MLLVGLAGFEPTTFGPPDRRANQAAPQPVWRIHLSDRRVGLRIGLIGSPAGGAPDGTEDRRVEAAGPPPVLERGPGPDRVETTVGRAVPGPTPGGPDRAL